MKKFEINAFSYDEAKQKALDMGLSVIKNVTTSFKKATEDNTTPFDFDGFAEDMLKKNKLSDTTGVGLMVVVEAGSADTRERPYKFTNNVVDGSIQRKRVFEICRASDNVVLASADFKSDAIRKGKDLMKTVRENLVCKVVYRVVGNKEVAFTLDYTPSVNTKEGKYIVFGY